MKRGFSDLLFIATFSFLLLVAGVATSFGLLGQNRPFPEKVACLVRPTDRVCVKDKQDELWVIQPAKIDGEKTSISFYPPSDGRINLKVSNTNENIPSFDSGVISEGRSSHAFRNLPKGSYKAVLMRGDREVSGVIAFIIS